MKVTVWCLFSIEINSQPNTVTVVAHRPLYVDGGVVVGAINNNYCGFRSWFYKNGCGGPIHY